MRHALSALLLVLVACSKPPSPPPAPTAEKSEPAAAPEAYRLSGPHTHGNLSVYLIHSKDAPQVDFSGLTLEEALKSGAVKVTEKAEGAEVNELQVENTSDLPVYLQAGDTVKGGKQDRTIAVDAVLPPKSGKRSIDAFCVEPGRWASREGARYANVFGAAAAPVATNEQKLAIRLEKSQDKVWAAGQAVNKTLAASAGGAGPATGATFTLEEPKNSYVEAVEDPKIQKKLTDRIAALEKAPADQKDAVGAVFCVNGRVQTAEIYGAAGLFRKLWPKLLRSAAVEALAKQTDGEPAKPPAEAEIRALLADAGKTGGNVEVRPGGQTVRVFERDRAVLFDTEADGKLLHRQLITR